MNNGNEQLDKLLRQLMDEDNVADLKKDLSFADKLFADHPVPAVRRQTLSEIRAKVHHKLIQRRFMAAGRWIAIAAAVLMMVVLFHDYEHGNSHTITKTFSTLPHSSQNLWADEFYVLNLQDDPIERELAELADSIQAVRTTIMYDTTDTFSIDMKELDEIERLADNISSGKDNFYAH